MIGNRMKAVRESMGMKQKEFAEMLGMRPTTYNGYETEMHEPKSDILVLIAQKCNVTVDYLLGLSEKPTEKFQEIEKASDPKEDFESEEEEFHSLIVDLTALFKKYGYLEENGDISDETLRMMKAWIDFLDSYFSAE